MIKFENNMLVLDGTATKEDVDALNEFVKSQRDAERQEILDRLQATLDGYKTVKDFEYFWTMGEIFDIINEEYVMRSPKVDRDDLLALKKTRVKEEDLLLN